MHPRRKRPRYLLPPTPSAMPPPLINSSSSTSTSTVTTAVAPPHHHLQPRPSPPAVAVAVASAPPSTSSNTSSAAPAGHTQACAACKFQRRKCAPDCVLAPYFPHDRTRQFQNAHKLFGVSNITKIIKNLGPREKDEAMRTIIYQSNARAHDPVNGCFGVVRDLQRQIDLCQAELDLVLRQLDFFRQQEAAAAALGCDLMTGPVPVSADPFVQAFGVLPPEDHLHHHNNTNNNNNSNNNLNLNLNINKNNGFVVEGFNVDHNDNGFVGEFNLNHDNNDAVAWAMQDCSTPTSNSNNGVNVMSHNHHHPHDLLHHHHGGDGGGTDDNNNAINSKQIGFNIVDQCDDIKPLILDLPSDDDGNQHHNLGFSSEESLDKSNQSMLEMDKYRLSRSREDEDVDAQRQEGMNIHHDHNDLKDAATFFTLTNCSS